MIPDDFLLNPTVPLKDDSGIPNNHLQGSVQANIGHVKPDSSPDRPFARSQLHAVTFERELLPTMPKRDTPYKSIYPIPIKSSTNLA